MDDRVQKVGLAAEVIVDRGNIDPGRDHDLAQRRAVDALEGKELFGGVHDLVAGDPARAVALHPGAFRHDLLALPVILVRANDVHLRYVSHSVQRNMSM